MKDAVSDLFDQFSDVHQLFAGTTAEIRDGLKSIANSKTLSIGEEIGRVSEPVEGLYLIITGSLRVNSLAADGKQLLVGILEAGDSFGIISVMDEKPSLHFASANTATTVVLLPAAPFRALVYEDGDLTRRVVKFLCQRSRLSFAVNDRFGLTATPFRVARCLSDISNYFAPGELAGPDLELEMNQYDLSSMLAISRQSVNRELKELERRDLVTIGYNRIRINDISRLQAFLE